MENNNNVDVLLSRRSFVSLLITVAANAFFDMYLCVAAAMCHFSLASHFSDGYWLLVLAFLSYMLPIIVFSAPAGLFADKENCYKIIRYSQFFGIFSLFMAVIGFAGDNPAALYLAIMAAGLKTAAYIPAQQAMLPQVVRRNNMALGNSLVQSVFFLMSLIVVISGMIKPLFFHTAQPEFSLAAAAIPLLIALFAGIASSLGIAQGGDFNPELKITPALLFKSYKNIFLIGSVRGILLCVVGISWFYFLISVIVFTLPYMLTRTFGQSAPYILWFLGSLAAGIVCGMLWCNQISRRDLNARMAPISALFMALFIFFYAITGLIAPSDIVQTSMSFGGRLQLVLMVVYLMAFGFAAGVYMLPHYSMLQRYSGAKRRGRIAAVNIVINMLAAASGILFFNLISAALGIYIATLLLALLAAVEAFITCFLLPEHILRIIVRRIMDIVYGVKVRGIDNLFKPRGNCLVIANHTSFLDGVLIWAYMPYKFYYAIDTFQAKTPVFRLIAPLIKFFTINPSEPMSVKTIIDEVKSGHRVVIFPEGRITTTGALMKVYPGPSMIADSANAEILPICIEGSQFSVFARFGSKLKTRLHSKITMTILPPVRLNVPPEITGHRRRNVSVAKMSELMQNMRFTAAPIDQTLFDALIDAKQLVGRSKPIIEERGFRIPRFSVLGLECENGASRATPPDSYFPRDGSWGILHALSRWSKHSLPKRGVVQMYQRMRGRGEEAQDAGMAL